MFDLNVELSFGPPFALPLTFLPLLPTSHLPSPADVASFDIDYPIAGSFLYEQCRADFLAGRIGQATSSSVLKYGDCTPGTPTIL